MLFKQRQVLLYQFLQQLAFSAQAGYAVAAEFILQTFEYPLCLVTLAPHLQFITVGENLSVIVQGVGNCIDTGTGSSAGRQHGHFPVTVGMCSAQGCTQFGKRPPGHRAHVLLIDYQHMGDFKNTRFQKLYAVSGAGLGDKAGGVTHAGYIDLALAYNEVRRPEAAIAQLEKTVELAPGFSRAWYNLGLALRDKGDTEGALRALVQAEALEPGSNAAPYARALILAQEGRHEEAVEAAQTAVRLNPEDESSQRLLVDLMRAGGAPPR